MKKLVCGEMVVPLPQQVGQSNEDDDANAGKTKPDKRMRRWGLSNRPKRRAMRKKTVECLFSMPNPASRPKSNQAWGFAEPSATRSTMKSAPIQKQGSKAFIDRKLVTPRKRGPDIRAVMASIWAFLLPPSCQVSRPVRPMVMLPAIKLKIRTPVGRDAKQNLGEARLKGNQRRMVDVSPG